MVPRSNAPEVNCEEVEQQQRIYRDPFPGNWVMLREITWTQAHWTARRLLRKLNINLPNNLELELLHPDPTSNVNRATQLCREFSDEVMFNHCMRAYLFAMAVAVHEGVELDREMLFVAIAFHDFGLSQVSTQSGDEWISRSFEVRGAARCYDFAVQEAGWASDKASMLHEAIRMHSVMGLAEKGTPIGRFINIGSTCDVFGYHMEDINNATKKSIVETYPRLNFKESIITTFESEVKRGCPCGTASFYMNYAFFKQFVRRGPFQE